MADAAFEFAYGGGPDPELVRGAGQGDVLGARYWRRGRHHGRRTDRLPLLPLTAADERLSDGSCWSGGLAEGWPFASGV